MRSVLVFAVIASIGATACEEAGLQSELDAGRPASTRDGGVARQDAATPPSDAGSASDASSGFDAGAPPRRLVWTSCEAEIDPAAECARLNVPLDHQQPGSETIELHLTRYAATVPFERRGVLIVNSGGPGAGAQSFAGLVSRTYYRMQERFDVIGVDVRGTGRSVPAMHCADAAMRDRKRAADPYVDLLEYQAASKAIGDACRNQYGDRIVSHMSTVEAAMDLELVRIALEEEQLNYLGVGHGTMLGAVYASLYPERVRAFVLDSIVKPSWDLTARMNEGTAAKEAVFDTFLTWCKNNPAICDFHGGRPEDQTRSAWDALIADLAANGGIYVGDRTFTSLDMRYLTARLLSGPSFAELASLLADVEAGDAIEALAAADLATGRRADGTYSAYHDANFVITCNDQFGPEKAVLAKFDQIVAELASSRFGLEQFADFRSCDEWPEPDPPFYLSASYAPPMYLVNGTNDPSTPAIWAEEMRDVLGNQSFYQLIDQPGHGMFDRVPAVTRIENFVLAPEREPGPFSCVDTPPIAHTSTAAIRIDGQVNVFSTMVRTATVPVTVELYESESHQLIATVTATLTNTRFPSMWLPISDGRPIFFYVRATAEGLISGEHHYRSPFVKNVFVSVNLADESMFERIFSNSPNAYDPSLTAIRIYATDCDRRQLVSATLSEDSPSGFIWYGQERDNNCTYAGAISATDGVCEPMGINFAPGEVTLTVSKENDRFARRLLLRPRTFVQYDVGP